MVQSPKPIPTISGIDRKYFDEVILPAGKPVVIRDVNQEWPSVVLAKGSDAAIATYLTDCSNDTSASTAVGGPEIDGTFFYGETTRSLNFERVKMTVPQVVTRLLAERGRTGSWTVAMQAALLTQVMPRFAQENKLSLLPAGIRARVWIGNSVCVQTHSDPVENIACVVAGKRRFTLFPPDQIGNLYIGPMEHTLAGTPISMVKVKAPDFDLYPKYKDALQAALTADLGPGDAIYIPYLWWHNVESLSDFNVLVNYWWNDDAGTGQPHDCLLHAILSLRDLPSSHREIWRTMLDHYVFGANGDPGAHLPLDERGVLGPLSPQAVAALQEKLVAAMRNRPPPGAPKSEIKA